MFKRGFTLIEIMIALIVFAILAMITSSVLVQTLHIQERVNAHNDDTVKLELTLSLLQQDTTHFISRAVRGNEMHLFPSIIAQPTYIEFTRGGILNPLATEQRSELARVAYVCENHQLIRRVWQQLDTPDRQDFRDTMLLSDLKQCRFDYMGLHNQFVETWYQAAAEPRRAIPFFLPKAIRVKLQQQPAETPSLFLFIIPEGVYG